MPDQVTDIPRQTRTAVKFLYIALGFGVIGALFGIMSVINQASTTAMQLSIHPDTAEILLGATFIIGVAITYGVYWFFISKIHRGRNWARVTYLVLFLVGIPFGIAGMAKQLSAELPFSFVSGIAQYALQIIALVILFRKPSSEWFQQMKEPKPPAETAPTVQDQPSGASRVAGLDNPRHEASPTEQVNAPPDRLSVAGAVIAASILIVTLTVPFFHCPRGGERRGFFQVTLPKYASTWILATRARDTTIRVMGIGALCAAALTTLCTVTLAVVRRGDRRPNSQRDEPSKTKRRDLLALLFVSAVILALVTLSVNLWPIFVLPSYFHAAKVYAVGPWINAGLALVMLGMFMFAFITGRAST